MLSQQLEKIKEHLPDFYTPFPSVSDRAYWEGVSDKMKNTYILEAGKYLDFVFPPLTATEFLEYNRTGNRTGYQQIYSERRIALNLAIMAELFENKGRFIDLMIDIMWLLCEQTTWIIPAHNAINGYMLPLSDYDRPVIDLMAADVSASISLALYFFKDKFDAVSPQIYRRAKHEITERILKPYRYHTDYWWMGFMYIEGEQLNNWNPWINSNVLISLLLIEDDKHIKYYTLHKIAESLDKYINDYPEDGGCDEGPIYWGRAGASLFECLEIFYDYTTGNVNIFNESKIKNMCKFIYRAHINNMYFVNFADASPETISTPAIIYRFGKHTKDKASMAFASYLYKFKYEFDKQFNRFCVLRPLNETKVINELISYKGEYTPTISVYLDNIQVAYLREHSGFHGLYLAVKGGHNNENHNHNDIGNFIVYASGKPFIIDVGSMTYTRKTFSASRYELWNICSLWHNVPFINGRQQRNGKKFKAVNTSFSEKDGIGFFSTELQDAYPKESEIVKWKRTFVFERVDKKIVITDEFELEKPSADVTLHLICLPRPVLNGNAFTLTQDQTTMRISFGDNVSSTYEKINLDAAQLYRVSLSLKTPLRIGSISIKIDLI